MRPLTEPETKVLFEKLATYCGKGISHLIADPSSPSDRNVFRISGSRCYYIRSSLSNLATSVARDNLLSLGICLGKFTKTGKFRLHITALPVIAPHARYKVWVKQNGEMPFLYGGNVLKAHVGRWSEDCPEHAGVVVLSMNDTPLVSHVPRSTRKSWGCWEMFLSDNADQMMCTGLRSKRAVNSRGEKTGSNGHCDIQTSGYRGVSERRRHVVYDLSE